MTGRPVTRAFVSAIAALCTLLSCAASAQDAQKAAPANAQEYLGPAFRSSPVLADPEAIAPRRHTDAAATFRYWNTIAVDASGLDHTPVRAGETRTFGEQLGPGRAARAIAIVHIAIFDAVNSILGGYRSYTGIPRTFAPASLDAAIIQAAHDTLVRMFPSQKPTFDALRDTDLNQVRTSDPRVKARGIEVGRRAAAAILARRANDGSAQADPRMDGEYPGRESPGEWRQDPISQSPIALGWKWGTVRPFVMRSGTQFRAPPPPAMSSARYTEAFNEVKALGGETSSARTADQTETGLYWAYDGTPTLCAPPRLYNQIAREVSKSTGNVIRLARLFALVHVALADAGVAVWESKFFYKTWRPITGIREADEGTGPSGLGDGNPLTIAEPTFVPLGAPASNLQGPNFTPPFPAYPSGHAGFGGALFQILRSYYGTDRVAFTFTSDELNGETVGNDGMVRPLLPRTFRSFSQAEEENGQSRIYLGIHWEFDKTEGIAQGRRVANYVYRNAFQPVR